MLRNQKMQTAGRCIKEKTEDLMTRGINRCLLLLTAVIFLISCGRNVVFTDSSAMPGRIWNLEEQTRFQHNGARILSTATISISFSGPDHRTPTETYFFS